MWGGSHYHDCVCPETREYSATRNATTHAIQVVVDLFAPQNTTLAIYNDVTLEISNAPTSINTVYTGTTSTVVTRAKPPTPSQYGEPEEPGFSYNDGFQFIISMKNILHGNDPDNARQANVKRQLGGQGMATDSCTDAVIYTLVQGRLYANGTGAPLEYGTTPQIVTTPGYAPFVPALAPGSITTVFAVDTQYNLLWNNVAFFNNEARFCVMPDNSIMAVFVDPANGPTGCIFVALSLTRVSNCIQNLGPGPTGPTGVCYCLYNGVSLLTRTAYRSPWFHRCK